MHGKCHIQVTYLQNRGDSLRALIYCLGQTTPSHDGYIFVPAIIHVYWEEARGASVELLGRICFPHTD